MRNALIGVCLGVSVLVVRADQGGRPAGLENAGTALITGRVVEAESGRPVPAAVATLTPTGLRRPGPREWPRVLTDQDGRFFFRDVAAGAYSISAAKPGWIPGEAGRHLPEGAASPIEIRDGERMTDVTIPMWRHATISGRVIDEAGEPLVGVDMRVARLRYVAGRRQASFEGRTHSDDRGMFRFSTLVPGDYVVLMPSSVASEPTTFAGATRAAGETPRAYLQTMTAVGTAPMAFSRAETVAGGNRSVLASVVALPGTPEGDGPWLTYPATFHPSVTTLAGATVVRAVSGRDHAGADVTVRLVPTYEISGVVTLPDGPAAYHAVHLLTADAGDGPLFDISMAVTDATGAFTLYGVPPGSFVARVVRTPWPEGEGGRIGVLGGTGAVPRVRPFYSGPTAGPPPIPTEPVMHASEPVTVGERHVRGLRLTLAPGPRVRGRAEFAGSTAPPTPQQLAGVSVAIAPASGITQESIWSGRFMEDGKFVTPSTWPGRYLLQVPAPPSGWTMKSATHQGRDLSDTPFDLTSDLDDVVITFTDRPATIGGTVQGSQGQPGRRAVVLLFPADPAGWVDYGGNSRRVQSATASATGAYSMPAPPMGEYFLIAVPDAESDGWQNPAVLRDLAARADRVQVRDGQSLTHALRIPGGR